MAVRRFKNSFRLLLISTLVILNIYLVSELSTGITGSGAIVINQDTSQVYYDKNADIPRPIASTTKLLSIYLVLEEIDNNTISLNSRIPASDKAIEVSNDPYYSGYEQLKSNEYYKVEDLIKLSLVSSCNGSTIALAEYIAGTEEAFVDKMNNQASAWNLDATFSDCCGVSDDNKATPRAIATIAQHLIEDHPEILDYTSLTSINTLGKEFKNTNNLIGQYDGLDGLKTGTTNAAGYCLIATAERNNNRIISVVLNSISSQAREYDTITILDLAFNTIY